ncbi:TPA: hypothetical protein ACH3X1_016697 [Trebouxia sp. C0004]
MTEMRRRQAVSVEELLQEPYLDAEEQKEVVHRLKQQHARQSQQWTTVFGVLAVVLGIGCLYLSWHQLRDPWGLRHHAFFSGSVNSGVISLAEACSGTSLLLSAAALMTIDTTSNNHTPSQQHCKPVLIINALYAVLTAVLWSYLLRTAVRFQEESLLHAAHYMWLPFGPMLYMLLVFYLLHSLNGTACDVAKLQTSMYNLHTA